MFCETRVFFAIPCKCLGIVFNSWLTWGHAIKEFVGKADKAVSMIRCVMWKLSLFDRKGIFIIFFSLVILCFMLFHQVFYVMVQKFGDTNIIGKLSKYISICACQSWELKICLRLSRTW